MRLKDVFDLKIGRIPEYLIMVRQPPSPIEDVYLEGSFIPVRER